MTKLIVFLLGLVPATIFASGSILERGSLFHKTEKAYDRYQMITGKVLFQKRNSETHTKGYRPSAYKYIGGEVVKKIYDFSPQTSPSMLFNEYRSYLASNGYEIIFECENTDCGPLPGWKLYLSEDIGGSPSNQYYAAAIRRFDEAKSRKHVILYLSEIDDRPRLILHEVTGSEARARFTSFPPDQLQGNDDLGLLHEIFFEKGQHEEFSDDSFDQFVEAIKKLPEEQELVLIGFADPTGDKASNYDLAKKRANKIRRILVNQHGYDGNKTTVLSGGELSLPKGDKQDHLSRKVSVYRFTPEAF